MFCFSLVVAKKSNSSMHAIGKAEIGFALLRVLLTEELEYFGAGTFSDQLDVAYKHFLGFCRSRRIHHSQAPFVPKMVSWQTCFWVWRNSPKNAFYFFRLYVTFLLLHLPRAKVKKKNGEVLLTAKAWNGRILVMWLNYCLLDAMQRHPQHEILLLTTVAMMLGAFNHVSYHFWFAITRSYDPCQLSLRESSYHGIVFKYALLEADNYIIFLGGLPEVGWEP